MSEEDQPMNASVVLAVIDGALRIMERLWPELARLGTAGEISAEDQAALRARVDRLRAGGQAFEGPEWEVSKN